MTTDATERVTAVSVRKFCRADWNATLALDALDADKRRAEAFTTAPTAPDAAPRVLLADCLVEAVEAVLAVRVSAGLRTAVATEAEAAEIVRSSTLSGVAVALAAEDADTFFDVALIADAVEEVEAAATFAAAMVRVATDALAAEIVSNFALIDDTDADAADAALTIFRGARITVPAEADDAERISATAFDCDALAALAADRFAAVAR